MRILIAVSIMCSLGQIVCAQDNTTLDKITEFPTRFFSVIANKTTMLEGRLERQTGKYLKRLARKENKIRRKLAKIDSAAAHELFGNTEAQYEQFNRSINSTDSSATAANGDYLSYVDSIKTSLSFLQHNDRLLSRTKHVQHKVGGSLKNISQLQSKLQQSDQIKAFTRQRKEQIKQALGSYTKLPKGITASYNDFTRDVYYYSEQVREYKELLNNPDRVTKKALTLLNRSSAFQKFMREHSLLAGLLGVPGNDGTQVSITGLQTRAQVQQLIQTQLSSAGPNAQQTLQQNLQSAQSELNALKEKINKWGSSGGDVEMPDFKPNTQKKKTFFQRLEYGSNIQTARSNYFWPVTTDVGLSVGYKLSDKSIVGIGASYKVGWGKNIREIVITQEGMGLRSFVDVKLKGSFYASGGFEYNYQPLTVGIIPLPNGGGELAAAWQQSGLAGVSKIISIKSKFFKKTKVQLLWDFLSYQQAPRTQALKFRVGYKF